MTEWKIKLRFIAGSLLAIAALPKLSVIFLFQLTDFESEYKPHLTLPSERDSGHQRLPAMKETIRHAT